MLMKSFGVATVVAVAAVSLLGALPARANTYDFTYQTSAGPSYTISGVITTSNSPNGGTPDGFDITGIIGQILSPDSSLSTASLFAGNATPPAYINNPSWVDYDNSLIPGTGVTSTGGWMIQSSNTYLYNLWLGNGQFGSTPGLVYLYSNDPLTAAFSNIPNGPGEPGTFLTLQQTPLPSTWTMLVAGFAGVSFFAYRGSKKNSASLTAA